MRRTDSSLGRAPLSTSIQGRLFVLCTLAALAFSAVVGPVAFVQAFHAAQLEDQDSFTRLIDTLENSATIAAYAKDPVLAQELADGLVRDPTITAASLTLRSGQTLGRAGPSPEAGAQASVSRVLRAPFRPFEELGTIELYGNQPALRARAQQRALVLAGVAVGAALCMALVVYALTSMLVSRPISRIVARLIRLQPDSREQLPVPRGHEQDQIGQLVHSLNAMLRDNAAALHRERELRTEVTALERQYRAIFDASSAGIVVLAPQGGLINANPTLFRMLGVSREQAYEQHGTPWWELAFKHPEQFMDLLKDARSSASSVTADLELKDSAPLRWVHCLLSAQGPQAGQPVSVEGVLYDITARRAKERATLELAETDALTGLRNRRSVEDAIDMALQNGRELALLYIDLDGFKQVNDHHGHDAGDRVLRRVAQRLRDGLQRGSDLVARLGGDEFVVVLVDCRTDSPRLAEIAQCVLSSLQQPFTLAGVPPLVLGASIGIACAPHSGLSRPALMRAADMTMYEVKRTGKNAFAMAWDNTLHRPGKLAPSEAESGFAALPQG
ncbi:diguanylate cyclase domain-containing protein [Roseateles sp. BYS180W]|uniref:Diguanylate cyclase domain-containing protein n=1 Tax=Roseateles rivi TaxID=3299028 RepID=A0ABW7FQU4_9BURK